MAGQSLVICFYFIFKCYSVQEAPHFQLLVIGFKLWAVGIRGIECPWTVAAFRSKAKRVVREKKRHRYGYWFPFLSAFDYML